MKDSTYSSLIKFLTLIVDCLPLHNLTRVLARADDLCTAGGTEREISRCYSILHAYCTYRGRESGNGSSVRSCKDGDVSVVGVPGVRIVEDGSAFCSCPCRCSCATAEILSISPVSALLAAAASLEGWIASCESLKVPDALV